MKKNILIAVVFILSISQAQSSSCNLLTETLSKWEEGEAIASFKSKPSKIFVLSFDPHRIGSTLFANIVEAQTKAPSVSKRALEFRFHPVSNGCEINVSSSGKEVKVMLHSINDNQITFEMMTFSLILKRNQKPIL